MYQPNHGQLVIAHCFAVSKVHLHKLYKQLLAFSHLQDIFRI